MRSLVLLHQGAPMLVSLTATPVRKRILEMPEDDADLFTVWSVPTDESLNLPADITEQFALTWALEFSFGDGIDPVDYLSPLPAFVREAARDKLIAKWQSQIIDLPNPLRMRA